MLLGYVIIYSEFVLKTFESIGFSTIVFTHLSSR
jgi:hypothetical protein